MFILFLGATCKRETLLTDYMIAVKVSAVQLLLLAGIYVSSMSSCLGAMYGTPRVLQSIALENVIPGIGILGKGVSGFCFVLFCKENKSKTNFAIYLIAWTKQSATIFNGRCGNCNNCIYTRR